MKFNIAFQDKINCQNSDDVFSYLISNLKETITKWDYFVNWSKVRNGVDDIEMNLNILNYLVGKDDITAAATKLLTEHPQVISTIPVLLACRQNKFQLLNDYKNGSFVYEGYDLSSKSKIPTDKAVEFMEKSGFLEQLKSKRIKSLVDYAFGVEVGLDSNGRKNRGGTAMEDIIEFFVDDLCRRRGFEYIDQATAPKIKEKWGKTVTVDKSTRRIDFAINTPNQLYLIETNFYSGGGSKLKSTAGEYKTLYDCLSNDGHQFIWITDGAGWHSTKRPLEETFNHIDFILNLSMIEKGILEDLVK